MAFLLPYIECSFYMCLSTKTWYASYEKTTILESIFSCEQCPSLFAVCSQHPVIPYNTT